MAITLDVTGFYYAIPIPFDATIVTVLDVLNAARLQRAPNGGVLDFSLDSSLKFVQTLSVFYDNASDPTSRQANLSVLPKQRPRGKYSFTDDVFDANNRIDVAGGISGLHAWQYYIFDENNQLKTTFGPNSARGIVPVSESDQPPFGVTLADKDTIVWRLVGIFGLNQFFDANRPTLIARSGGQPLSFKTAIDILKKENIAIDGMDLR